MNLQPWLIPISDVFKLWVIRIISNLAAVDELSNVVELQSEQVGRCFIIFAHKLSLSSEFSLIFSVLVMSHARKLILILGCGRMIGCQLYTAQEFLSCQLDLLDPLSLSAKFHLEKIFL